MSQENVCLGQAWRQSLGLVGLLLIAFSSALHAASSIETVGCGQIVTREFNEAHQTHDFKIPMDPGGTLNVRVVPLGNTLLVRADIYEPNSQRIVASDSLKEVRLNSGVLSGRGVYTIKIFNFGHPYDKGRFGVYTLEISCILADGSKVDAGSQAGGLIAGTLQAPPEDQAGGSGTGLGRYADDVQKIQSAASAAQQTVQLVSGVVDLAKGLKFWGKKKGTQEAGDTPAPAYPRPEDMVAKGQQLAYAQPVETPPAFAPKSVASPVQAPPGVDRQAWPLLGLGTLLQGEISESTGAQGCRFQAKAGQGIDLKFERLAGDQGLKVTVFGPDQQPVFMTNVFANPKISTNLLLQAAGEYAVEIGTAGSAGGSARFSLQLAATSK